jgi:hypothetical protein
VTPWLITSFGLVASRHLMLTMLMASHHRIGILVAAAGVATTIACSLALVAASRRSTSRKRSPS